MYKIGREIDRELFKEIEEELIKRPLPINIHRKTSGIGRSQVFGIVKQRGHYYAGSKMNYSRPELFQKLLKLSGQILDSDFTFCSIQVNQNYQTAPHKDKGNRGNSCIIGFGDYTNGELVIEGQKVDINYKTLYFDGSKYLHSTEPYTGNRYSLVFHTVNRDFNTLPIWSFETVNEKICLSEMLNNSKRIYSKDGNVVYSSDGLVIQKKARKPVLRLVV